MHVTKLIPTFLCENRGSIVQTVHTCSIPVCCFTKKWPERNYAVFLHEDGLNLDNAYYFVKVWFLPRPAKYASQYNIYIYLPTLKRYGSTWIDGPTAQWMRGVPCISHVRVMWVWSRDEKARQNGSQSHASAAKTNAANLTRWVSWISVQLSSGTSTPR